MKNPETEDIPSRHEIPLAKHKTRSRRRRRNLSLEKLPTAAGEEELMTEWLSQKQSTSNLFAVLSPASDSSDTATESTPPKQRVTTAAAESSSSCKTEPMDDLCLPVPNTMLSEMQAKRASRKLRRKNIKTNIPRRDDSAETVAKRSYSASSDMEFLVSSEQNLEPKNESVGVFPSNQIPTMATNEKSEVSDVPKTKKVSFTMPPDDSALVHDAFQIEDSRNTPSSQFLSDLPPTDPTVPLVHDPTHEHLYGLSIAKPDAGWPAVAHEPPAPTTRGHRSRFFPSLSTRSPVDPGLDSSSSNPTRSTPSLLQRCRPSSPTARFLGRFQLPLVLEPSTRSHELGDDLAEREHLLADTQTEPATQNPERGFESCMRRAPTSFPRSPTQHYLKGLPATTRVRHSAHHREDECLLNCGNSLYCSEGMVREDCRIARRNYAQNLINASHDAGVPEPSTGLEDSLTTTPHLSASTAYSRVPSIHADDNAQSNTPLCRNCFFPEIQARAQTPQPSHSTMPLYQRMTRCRPDAGKIYTSPSLGFSMPDVSTSIRKRAPSGSCTIAQVLTKQLCSSCESKSALRLAAERYIHDTQEQDVQLMQVRTEYSPLGDGGLGGDGHATRQGSFAVINAAHAGTAPKPDNTGDLADQTIINDTCEDLCGDGTTTPTGKPAIASPVSGKRNAERCAGDHDHEPELSGETSTAKPLPPSDRNIQLQLHQKESSGDCGDEWVLAYPGGRLVVLEGWLWDWALVDY